MIYALNVYDIIPGKEAQYTKYAARVAECFDSLDITIVAAGHQPIRELAGQSRDHFALAAFGDMAAFDALMDRLTAKDLHDLRQRSTSNYIWTLYEPWEFGR